MKHIVVPCAKPRDPKATFTFGESTQAFTVSDFWKYALSDLVTNMNRGALAEFIVEMALNPKKDPEKLLINDFQPFDIEYREKHIEVKSSAFLQRWSEPKKSLSRPSFSIKKRLETNKFDKEPERHWDIIICALLAECNPDRLDPLKLEQWEFYVLSREKMESHMQFKEASSLTLNHLRGPLGITSCRYGELRCVVDTFID